MQISGETYGDVPHGFNGQDAMEGSKGGKEDSWDGSAENLGRHGAPGEAGAAGMSLRSVRKMVWGRHGDGVQGAHGGERQPSLGSPPPAPGGWMTVLPSGGR